MERLGSDSETHFVHILLEASWNTQRLQRNKAASISSLVGTHTLYHFTCIFLRACLASLYAPVCLACLATVKSTALYVIVRESSYGMSF